MTNVFTYFRFRGLAGQPRRLQDGRQLQNVRMRTLYLNLDLRGPISMTLGVRASIRSRSDRIFSSAALSLSDRVSRWEFLKGLYDPPRSFPFPLQVKEYGFTPGD
jgi:hypothetical protein